MNITGEKLIHKKFGKGTVVSVDNDRLIVHFCDRESELGLETCLKNDIIQFENKDVQNGLIQELKEKEEALAIKKQQEYERMQIERAKQAEEYAKSTPKSNLVERSNIAFKCTYCDGGANSSRLGFCGICSDENIKNNILKEKRTWCSAEDSLCRQYLDGKITREELEEKYTNDRTCVCYESHLFYTWSYSAGLVVVGKNKGKPNTIRSIQTNSLCVLTTLKPKAKQNERKIFGVFIVIRAEEGDEYSAGKVTAHSKYRLTLSESEAEKMLFCNYYKNSSETSPNKWGTGLFRYLDDDACVKILKDIATIKQGTADEALANEMLDYYCEVNKLMK